MMRHIRIPVRTRVVWLLLAVLLALFSTCSLAQQADAEALPSKEQLQKQLDERIAGASDPPSESAQQDIDALTETIDSLDKLADIRRQFDELDKHLEEAPQEIEQLEEKLRQRQESPGFDAGALEGMTFAELEAQLRQANHKLQQEQDALTEVQSELLGARTLPERAQQTISDTIQRLDETRLAMEDFDRGDVPDDDPQRLAYLSRQLLDEEQLRLSQHQLNTNTRFRELLQQRSELLEVEVASVEAWVSALQGRVDMLRRERSEQAIAEAVKDEPEAVAAHPVIRQAQQDNRQLSLDLLDATSKSNELVRDSLDVRRQLDRVRRMQQGLSQNIEAVRGSVLLSRILREQREALPNVEPRRELRDNIADLRLEQFELDEQREQLRFPERLARQALEDAGVKDDDMESLVPPLEQLYRSRRDLIGQLEPIYGDMLTSAIELQLNQQQLLSISESLRKSIDEQLFWVANARPIDLAWLKRLPEHFVSEWTQGEWRRVLPNNWRWPDSGAWSALPVLLLALVLLLLRRKIKRHLLVIHEQIGRLRFDTQLHTPKAVILNALLAAPAPLALLAFGLVLELGGAGVAVSIGQSVVQLSLAWGVVAWARRLLVNDGVARRHFHWPLGYVQKLRWWMLWLGVSLIPVLLIAPLARDAAVTFNQRPLGLGLLLIGLTGMSISMAKLIMAHTPFFGIKLFRLILGLLMAMIPLVIGGAVLYGYVYSALSLVSRFGFTLYLLGVWILVEAAVVRGLAVAARRLAYRRALARRRAMTQDESERGLDIVEEPPLDMEQVNQQSLRFSKLILTLGFAALLYLVWADFLAVLGYLDNVTLVEGAAGEGAEALQDRLSVADVVIALFIAGLTMMLARNLPGLLEVLVLSRLELKQGSSYAITSLLSYTIVGTGTVMALATLGVSWTKLQWLVAALGVGLGFGLQEIFANFISGLIILFERPVRIGDTITLGNLTGTVSRIRIRATTVTDFDRKEIIIPNKTFVTDQLINWSLSDSVTRVTLHYRVSHDADRHVVHRLLVQAAHDNSRVLSDPPPEIFFMAYTSSAMEYELRIYVNALGDRLPATDEVNGAVGDLFAEHGIRIAFEKMDVHIQHASHESWGSRPARPGDSEQPPMGRTGDPGDVGIGDGDGGGDGGGR
ncbi:mechanosensitive channel MscK [Halomonas binhaiensis]|uniref:Mechanosensitive channel MscK n=1 Tax=Halomonas binhaiensis TaxID=2562282 RepID=A0A5C1NHR1_9GAMM|nr:mechanosensitive channel MscK [Halomonas binhaiensis]QEM81249.1 mechanosensitive channel MscK [Halomonas binhaiensis]